jgi:hypothetical protein
VKRGQTPIHEAAGLLNHKGKDAGIDASIAFTEWEACHGAGLDLWQWENGLYPARFKAKVIAWYEAHRLVEVHVRDANAPKRK